MKFKNSDLEIENIYVIAFNLNSIPVDAKNPTAKLQKGNLDIDFEFLHEKKDAKFKIILSLSHNVKKPIIPGYSFSLVTEGIFNFNNFSSLSKVQIDRYLTESALPIIINFTRSFLMSSTSQFPFGKFILPSIDLTELLQDKKSEVKKQGTLTTKELSPKN